MPTLQDKPLMALRQLGDALDRMIRLANAAEWEAINENSDDLLELFGKIDSVDYAALAQQSGGASTDVREEISTILKKIGQLAELLGPEHERLGLLLAGQINSRKLSEAYRG